jgi:clan AA aspartic protease (TIGR02281 family)
MHSIYRAETPQRVSKESYDENYAQVKKSASVTQEARRLASDSKLPAEGKMGDRPGRTSAKASYTPNRLEDKGVSGNESVGSPSMDRQKEDFGHGQAEDTHTGVQWFEKGKALDDDSEAEIQCYQRAIETDPKFAPPYYRLGAIYYRQANFELADDEFANFLQYASDAEKEAYDIYVYYSLAEAERLSEKMEEQAPAEEEEIETASEEEKEVSQETAEGVMTIVKFSSVDGHIMVPVVLNDFLNATVLVDTGAGITVLSRKLARDLGLEGDLRHSITLKTMALDIQAQTARLDSIQVGGLRRNYFPVAITDLSLGAGSTFDGILGMDFMNNYTIHINNAKQTMMLTPKAP